MAKIRFENGTTVNFDGDPTPEDIEEVAKSIQPTFSKSLLGMGKSVLNRFMPEPQSQGRGPLEAIGQLTPSERVSPMDIVTGMAPYKTAKLVKRGIEDAALPKHMKTGVPRAIYDISTDPETYAGGAILSKVAPKVAIKGGKILRSGMGISSDSARWIKTRGAKAIFTPEKESVDFIKTTLSPIVQKDVELATTGVIRQAEKMYSVAEGKLKTDKIVLDKAFNNAKNILNKYGFLDAKGRLLPSALSEEVPSQLKLIAKMYEKALPATGKISRVGPVANKAYFRFYRNLLGEFKRKQKDLAEMFSLS